MDTGWNPAFETRMPTYFRLKGLKLGRVLQTGERVLKAGIRGVVNGLAEDLDVFNPEAQRRGDAIEWRV